MDVSHGQLPFKLIVSARGEPEVTAHAGVPLVVEVALAVIDKRQYRALRDALGYTSYRVVRRHVLSLVTLIATGGECIDDLETLRADQGLALLLGFELSSPTQMKEFLYRFHQREDGEALTAEEDERLSAAGQAQIRPEGPGLRALAQMVRAVVEAVQRRAQQPRATLDVDATLIEAAKREALRTYEGPRGYQPQMAWWAEQSVWVCDEFRDGNVPAAFAVKEFLQKAFAALPATVKERRLRGDSALYDEKALTWADESGIQFAVSADMSRELLHAVMATPEELWKPYRTLRESEGARDEEERQWAEVEFVPDWARNRKKKGTPLRYIAIRVRSRQADLLLPASMQWRHFGVVTNMDWDGERLLRWQREKQGTVEHGHLVVKDELAGGTLPCGRFGANAAWWRINALVQNLLQLLKAASLPSEMSALRPKALRFRLFNVGGRLVRHGRQLFLRLSEKLPIATTYAKARESILALCTSPPGAPTAA